MNDLDVQRETSRQDRLRFWATVLTGGAAGLVVGLLFGWRPVPYVSSALQDFFALAPAASTAVAGSPAFGALSGAIAGALLSAAALSTHLGRFLLNRAFPPPPVFIRRNLARERSRAMILLDRPAPEFVGREDELRRLGEFAAGDEPFKWMCIAGASGLGKSRLAIEWLTEQIAAGADVGILGAEPPAGWRARLPTAIVIDDAWRRFGSCLDEIIWTLAEGASRHARLRVIVVDQLPKRRLSRSKRLPDRKAAAVEPADVLIIEPLAEPESVKLWRKLRDTPTDEMAPQAAHGSPRGLILLACRPAALISDALAAWVSDLVPELDEDNPRSQQEANLGRIRALCLAALAGPVPGGIVRKACGSFSPQAIAHFWPDSDLRKGLPAVEPDDLAGELLVRGIMLLDVQEGRKLFQAALRHDERRVKDRLTALWVVYQAQDAIRCDQAVSEHAKPPAGLVRLQQWFDAARPAASGEAVETLRRLRRDMAGAETLDIATGCFERAVAEYQARPFDPEVTRIFGRCVSLYLHILGSGFLFDDVERWAQWWHGRLRADVADREPELETERVAQLHCIMEHYGQAGRFDDLERWGARSIAARSGVPSTTASVAEQEAAVVATAIRAYEDDADPAALAPWAEAAARFARRKSPTQRRSSSMRLLSPCQRYLASMRAGGIGNLPLLGAGKWRPLSRSSRHRSTVHENCFPI